VVKNTGVSKNITGEAIGIKVGKIIDWDIYLKGNIASPDKTFKDQYYIE
jgi:hypothetical protein